MRPRIRAAHAEFYEKWHPRSAEFPQSSEELAAIIKRDSTSSRERFQFAIDRPSKAEVAEMPVSELIERMRRDAAGGIACDVFMLDRAADLLSERLKVSGPPTQPLNVSDERKEFDVYWNSLSDEDATDHELEICEQASWRAWQHRPRRSLALPLSAYPEGTTYQSIHATEVSLSDLIYQARPSWPEGCAWEDVDLAKFFLIRAAKGYDTRIVMIAPARSVD